MILVTGRELFSAVRCPIFFNIYGIKVNEGNCSSKTAIIHFLDKSSQEISFKSHSNGVILCEFAHVSFFFFSFYLFVLAFAVRLKDAKYKSCWNNFVFCNERKVMPYMNISREKIPDFASIPLCGFTLGVKCTIHLNGSN